MEFLGPLVKPLQGDLNLKAAAEHAHKALSSGWGKKAGCFLGKMRERKRESWCWMSAWGGALNAPHVCAATSNYSQTFESDLAALSLKLFHLLHQRLSGKRSCRCHLYKSMKMAPWGKNSFISQKHGLPTAHNFKFLLYSFHAFNKHSTGTLVKVWGWLMVFEPPVFSCLRFHVRRLRRRDNTGFSFASGWQPGLIHWKCSPGVWHWASNALPCLSAQNAADAAHSNLSRMTNVHNHNEWRATTVVCCGWMSVKVFGHKQLRSNYHLKQLL